MQPELSDKPEKIVFGILSAIALIAVIGSVAIYIYSLTL